MKTALSQNRWLLLALIAAFLVGVVTGGVLLNLMQTPPAKPQDSTQGISTQGIDVRQVGLSWIWLAFGFSAQAIFMSRMLVQWIASERARSSVVPVAFWRLSLLGGLMLLLYFWRRGDPVGLAGQLFGVIVYSRNLILIHRKATK